MIDRTIVAKEKLERASQLLREKKVDAWIVYSRRKRDVSLELLFDLSLDEEALFLLLPDSAPLAFCSPQDEETLRQKDLFSRVIPAEKDTVGRELRKALNDRKIQRMALNICPYDTRCDGLTLGLYRKLQSFFAPGWLESHQISSFEILDELRAVKSPTELAIMKACSRITTDVFDVVFSRIHIGMSETEVGDLMMDELHKRNAGTGIGDPTEYPLICIVRCGLAHRKPNKRNHIRAGDMLVIDFSARYNGYTSDIARTMYFLKPDESHAPAAVRRCADTIISAVGAVIASIRPGLHGYEVDAIGRKVIVDAGYPSFRHSVGHQVGLECHDGGTVLGPRPNDRSMAGVLRKNEVYAIEPTVLQDGGLPCGIIEDNVLLTDGGCKLISKRQTALIEIPYREA